MGEDETAWSNQGHANLIMGNLIAEGRSLAFIIVMTYGMTNDVKPGSPGWLASFDIRPFQTALVDHDEAKDGEMFNMREWLVYSTNDMKHWNPIRRS